MKARSFFLFLLAADALGGFAGTSVPLRAQGSEERAGASEIEPGEREQSRAQLLGEVNKGWQRPGVYQERAAGQVLDTRATPLAQKLDRIVLPSVNFTNVPLGRVVTTLSAASEEFDPTAEAKGVNIVLLDPAGKAPAVSITLRNLPLKRVLDFIVDSVGYQYEVQADAVVVRPGGETSSLETAYFAVTRSTVIRMTGIGSGAATGGGGKNGVPSSSGAKADPVAGEAAALRGFLQQAGVNFEATAGSSLAYDGSGIFVTQTVRNLERIRNILNRYNDVRQVEIEAKFMEVQEGALEELGVKWGITRGGIPQLDPQTGAPVLDATGHPILIPREIYGTDKVTRSLAEAFTNLNSARGISVVGGVTTTQTGTTNTTTAAGSLNVPVSPPTIPGGVSLGTSASALANFSGMIGEFDVNAVVRALSQKQGSDLLSAPKVTVLSGNPANMVIAQELRYPQSYGEIQSQVGTGSASGGGSAGVSITSGTPQEFTTRNVGVELKVTPTVEDDDYSISLDLNPKVTEFDGFVEYGGPSIAISGGTTVTVPPGFYQPIFSVREVSTKVTIWDGATLIMGGLTREEVKKVQDKVPVLGDLPLLGRLFRSKGQSSQKRNLLIFVTANLVSPGGSPKKQTLPNVQPNALFQNPTLVTPAGSESREDR